MVYTKRNITEIKDLYLHDSELMNLEISYFQKSLTIELKSSQGKKSFIRTKRLYHLIVEGKEPWGEGIYICELSVIVEKADTQLTVSDNDVFAINILMNSGDKIILYAKEVEFGEVF